MKNNRDVSIRINEIRFLYRIKHFTFILYSHFRTSISTTSRFSGNKPCSIGKWSVKRRFNTGEPSKCTNFIKMLFRNCLKSFLIKCPNFKNFCPLFYRINCLAHLIRNHRISGKSNLRTIKISKSSIGGTRRKIRRERRIPTTIKTLTTMTHHEK